MALKSSPPVWAPALLSKLTRQASVEGGVNCSNRVFRGRPSTLTAGKERPPPVFTCRTDCLTSPALVGKNQFLSNTIDRKYFATDTKPDQVHCNFQNYISLLTCTHCGVQYVG